MSLLIGVIIVGGAIAAASKRKPSGTSSASSGATELDPRGFRFVDGCRDLEVQDEAKALAWARQFTATTAGDWVMPFVQAVLGSCLVPLSANKAQAEAIAQKHIGFLWKLALHALRGAVAGGKLTFAEAEKRLGDAVALAEANGIDKAVLTPQTLPP